MTNRLYEGLFLFDANETARDWSALEEHLGALMKKHGLAEEYSERWPDQRLAYDIKGVKKGTYYLSYFNADPQAITPFRRDAELSEKLLRFLVVREEWTAEEMEKRREAAKRRAEQPAPPPPAEEGAAPAASPAAPAGEAAEAAPAAGATAVAEAPAPAAEAAEAPEAADDKKDES